MIYYPILNVSLTGVNATDISFYASYSHFILSKTETTIALCVRKIKKKRRFDGYTFSRCRSSGNICGWFSRSRRNGVLMHGLFFGILTSSGSDHSLHAPFSS